MGLAKEFKEFAMKGNVIDMAVGVIIGAAFGKIITSLVEDVIMPPLGKVIGGVNFTDLALSLGTDPDGKEVLLKYGNFLQIDVPVPDRRVRAVHGDPHPQQAQEARSGRAAAARRRARKCCCRKSATCSRRSNSRTLDSMAAVRYAWMFRTAAVVYLLFGLSGIWRFGLTDYDPPHRLLGVGLGALAVIVGVFLFRRAKFAIALSAIGAAIIAISAPSPPPSCAGR